MYLWLNFAVEVRCNYFDSYYDYDLFKDDESLLPITETPPINKKRNGFAILQSFVGLQLCLIVEMENQ